MIGLGLALAQPKKQVLVVTGDGDLLMNVGALATIAVMNPPNLAIVCVDNGHYGETGWQKSHTSLGVDLEKIAIGCRHQAHHDGGAGGRSRRAASRFIREGNSAGFVLLRVKPTEPPHFKRNFDAVLPRPLPPALGRRHCTSTTCRRAERQRRHARRRSPVHR